MQKRLLLAVIVISISSLVVVAQVEQPGPMPGTYIHDFAGVISEDKKAEIQGKAQRLKDEYKTEIALVTIDSLQGEDSFDYSMRMSRSWGIGSPDNEIRGLLILVAVKDRKTSFRTSRHIEGEIPDAVTYDVNQIMNGYFKRGDFGGGLSAGLDKLLARLQSVYEPSAAMPEKQSSGWIRFWIILWAGVAVYIAFEAFRKKRRERRENALKPKKAKSSSRSSESSTPSSSYSSSHSSSWGSSSSSGSGSSYSGGSDFGGGGSDSSW
ncbi:MAG TPA: TPM domain-containing protein [Blastocatellia bacterium]|nr:TPM domain-containing protein [Blastocatellia bacterium]